MTKGKIKAQVRATTIETKDYIARKGAIIEIPADERQHSPVIKYALETKNLVVMDLAPVTSEKAPDKTK